MYSTYLIASFIIVVFVLVIQLIKMNIILIRLIRNSDLYKLELKEDKNWEFIKGLY